MQSGVARNGDVQIAYEDFGKPGGRPLLLISGLDGQMIGWPSAGRTLARAVPHGRFVLVHRMGHMFSAPLWPELVSQIDRHAT